MPHQAPRVSQPTGSALLDSLSPQQFLELAPGLKRITVERGAALAGQSTSISTVYFPIEGMVSLVRYMANGDAAEVGVVGPEGVVGWPAMISADMGSIVAIVQLPMVALSLAASDLIRFIDGSPEFGQVLARAMQALFLQVAQTAACNQHHLVANRLAKWLLMASDRSTQSPMALTHEILAMLLGIRRAGVTEAMASLKAAGVLAAMNGRVTILNRGKLEQAACECYRVIRDETSKLLPGRHRVTP